MQSTKFLNAHGQDCTILRTPNVTSKVSMKLVTQSISDNREIYRDGIILPDSSLAGGEVMTVGSDTLLIRSIAADAQSGAISFLASKVNATLTHKRYTETTDSYGNVTQGWTTQTSNVYSTAQIVTAALRQEDPGLLDTTKWVFLIPDSVSVQKLDRLEFDNGEKCQVDSIDNVRLPGLLRVQCSDDTR